MQRQNLTGKTALGEKDAPGAPGWNSSLISRRLVRMEYLREPTESERHCQRRIAVATGIFLGLLLLLSFAALCLLWLKVSTAV